MLVICQPEKMFLNMKEVVHYAFKYDLTSFSYTCLGWSFFPCYCIAVLEDNTNGMQEILVGWQIGAKAVTRIRWAPQQDTPHV